MSDFGHYGGSEEDYATVRKHNAEVVCQLPSSIAFPSILSKWIGYSDSRVLQESNPDSFEHWENLIKACETLEGGLNRNSSPQALATFRDSYDRFLLKFPLLFGYWKKYADMEFNIAGPESAEMVGTWSCSLEYTLRKANAIIRSTKEASPASPILSTCGLSIAPSRWRQPTTHTSSESKYYRTILFP